MAKTLEAGVRGPSRHGGATQAIWYNMVMTPLTAEAASPLWAF